LQPEKLRFTVGDFDGPLGPGNPLAAALRAVREYLLGRHGDSAAAGEPYPLLLVRPEGVVAYYYARTAMRSWGDEFGYELIGQDWRLQFPPPDAELARSVAEAVQEARARQERLIAAAPRHYGTRSSTEYPASPFHGDTGADGNGGSGGDGGSGGSGFPGMGGYGLGAHPGNGGPGNTGLSAKSEDVAAAVNRPGTYDLAPAAAPEGLVGRGLGAVSLGQGTGNGGQATGVTAPSAARPGVEGGGQATGSIAQANLGVPARPENTAGNANPPDAAAAGAPARPDGFVVGRPPREEDQPPPGPQAPAAQGTSTVAGLRPGEWIERPPAPPPDTKDPPDAKKAKADARRRQENRGPDWGLPGGSRGSFPITRPVRVDCYADRLVIAGDDEPSVRKTVPLGRHTRDAIDPLISAVWEYMDTWGIAGKGMYWRPILHLYVEKDADQRYNDLVKLLEGSGLEVRRRQ
jgi:hypothetical protein